MPRAFDAYMPGGLPLTHDPTQRISYQPTRSVFNVEAFIAAWSEFVDTFLFPIILELTGIDLRSALDLLNGLLAIPLDILAATPLGDFLEVVGQFLPFLLNLNPLSFNLVDAATDFINLVLNPAGLLATIEYVAGAIAAIVAAIVEAITGAVGDVLDLAGWVGDLLGTLAGGATSVFVDIATRLANLLPDGLFDAAALTNIENIVTLPFTAVASLAELFAGIFNAWFGGTAGTGTPEEVVTTIEAIRTTVQGGWTLQTFTSSNASWSVPPELAAAVEAYAGVVGGGGKGAAGGTVTTGSAGVARAGGAGGVGGGYSVAKFDPAILGSTLAVTVGAAASTSGANGGTSSIGSIVSSIPGAGGIASLTGFIDTSSKPGDGGAGGDAVTNTSATNGAAGSSSALGAGGSGGALYSGSAIGSVSGGTGGKGGAGQTSDTPICGGGGGGGGGGCNAFGGVFPDANGGVGGAGGFPGGASGGGGAGVGNSSASAGAAGAPANGFGFLLWK